MRRDGFKAIFVVYCSIGLRGIQKRKPHVVCIVKSIISTGHFSAPGKFLSIVRLLNGTHWLPSSVVYALFFMG